MERLERLQPIADKVEHEAKRYDIFLDEVEQRIDEGAKRLDRLTSRDAKHRCDIVTSQLADVEEAVKIMFSQVQALTDENYNKTPDVQKRVQRIHQRFVSARDLFQNRLLSLMSSVMNTDANRSFQLSIEPKQLEIDNHFHFFFIEFPMSSHLFTFGQLRLTLDRSKP
jgi:predicted  nucleic acid-binding Zn-ribbon protein